MSNPITAQTTAEKTIPTIARELMDSHVAEGAQFGEYAGPTWDNATDTERQPWLVAAENLVSDSAELGAVLNASLGNDPTISSLDAQVSLQSAQAA